MKSRDRLLAVFVTAIWGFNFVFIGIGIRHLPPLLFGAIRFLLVAVPAIFIVGKPKTSWRWVIITGLTIGAAQFSLLFAGIAAGMPAGLSGLVIQIQVVFTTIFAMVLLREHPSTYSVAGAAVSILGLVIVGSALGPNRPIGAFILVLLAGAAWSVGNIAIRKAQAPDMMSFMVWMGAVATPPLFLLSLFIEGPTRILTAVKDINMAVVGALCYIAWVSTLVGYSLWGALIRRNGAATTAPFSMLIPVFAMASASVFLDEIVTVMDIVGGILIVSGVLIGAIPSHREDQPHQIDTLSQRQLQETPALHSFGSKSTKLG